MNSRTDQNLIREYAERRSETAFAELVRRHIDLVHSAASRMVKDPHLAEDVTQRVFASFAQQAAQLADRAVLSGWLHRTTQNLAAKTVRTEVRRRAREQEAVAMHESFSPQEEPAWEHVAPHLDAALGELNDADRDALLLRYFQRKTAREIADALGLNEEAAQKRVTRALEKLRGVFNARGVTVSTSALAGLLAVQAVQTAPAALVASVATASLAAGTVSTFSLLSLMASTKLKLGIAAVAAAGLVTPLVLQQQQLKQLRAENAALLEQAGELDALRAENERLARQPVASDGLALQQAEHLELLRLRGEVTRLGNELRRGQATQSVEVASSRVPPPSATTGPVSVRGSFKSTIQNGATWGTGGWYVGPGQRGYLLVTPHIVVDTSTGAGRTINIQTKLVEIPDDALPNALLTSMANNKATFDPNGAQKVFGREYFDLPAIVTELESRGFTNLVKSTPRVVVFDGQQARVSVGQEVPAINSDGNPTNHFVGTAIDLLPHITPDGEGISVEAVVSFVPPEAVVQEGVQPLPRLRASKPQFLNSP